MTAVGELLRTMRIEWGLSLRDVKKRSLALAQAWGNRSYEVSGSWLCKLERGEFEMTVPKLISLATIYSRPPEELLRECLPSSSPLSDHNPLFRPNATVLITNGPLDIEARRELPDPVAPGSIPELTTLLPAEGDLTTTSIRRAIVGTRDRALYPMIRPGSILRIDTKRRAIAHRREWTNEFDRPIYLLQTHRGLLSGWCELDKEGCWLTLVAHNLSHEPSQRWRYRKEVEVMGRAVAVALQLTPLEERQATSHLGRVSGT